jgi:REP element-mobilizing transposase RayT
MIIGMKPGLPRPKPGFAGGRRQSMPRRDIQFHAGEYYHLYNRGAFRNRVFHNRDEYALFLTKWRQQVKPAEVAVIAYCLMPNHYHLLVRAGDDQMGTHMHRFGTSFVKAWNRLRERTGVAFDGPFHAIHVDDEAYLFHLTRYIHRNPVAAGLVLRAEDWEFSSSGDYIGMRAGTLPQPELILREFSDVEAYRRFVEGSADESSIRHLLIDDED